jgi:uncharacterized protein
LPCDLPAHEVSGDEETPIAQRPSPVLSQQRGAIPFDQAGVRLLPELFANDAALVAEPECDRDDECDEEQLVETIDHRRGDVPRRLHPPDDIIGQGCAAGHVEDAAALFVELQIAIEAVTCDHHDLDCTVVKRVHQDCEGQPERRQEDGHEGSADPGHGTEGSAERGGVDRVAEHRRAEWIDTVSVCLEAADHGVVEQIREILRESEAEPDGGSVDDAVRDAVELTDTDDPREAPREQECGDEREALGELFDWRRRKGGAEDSVDVVAEEATKRSVPDSGKQDGDGRAPDEQQGDREQRFTLVEVEEPNQQEQDARLEQGVHDVDVRRREGRQHHLGAVVLVACLLGCCVACGGDGGTTASTTSLKTPTGIAVLDELPDAEPASTSDRPPRVVGSGALNTSEFLEWMGGNANMFWKRQFARAGLRYSPAGQLIVSDGDTAASLCRPARSKDGPFYCEFDHPPTVYLTHAWFEKKAKPLGDFAMAFIVAHEWGHHIQNLLGLFRVQVRYPRLVTNLHIELMADCLAGVWAKAVYHERLLEPGDIDEAVALAADLADRAGTSPRDPSAHGSAGERVSWFKRGYDSGRAAACKTWSGDPPNPVALGNARS